jgi:hypothetical protein
MFAWARGTSLVPSLSSHVLASSHAASIYSTTTLGTREPWNYILLVAGRSMEMDPGFPTVHSDWRLSGPGTAVQTG